MGRIFRWQHHPSWHFSSVSIARRSWCLLTRPCHCRWSNSDPVRMPFAHGLPAGCCHKCQLTTLYGSNNAAILGLPWIPQHRFSSQINDVSQPDLSSLKEDSVSGELNYFKVAVNNRLTEWQFDARCTCSLWHFARPTWWYILTGLLLQMASSSIKR